MVKVLFSDVVDCLKKPPLLEQARNDVIKIQIHCWGTSIILLLITMNWFGRRGFGKNIHPSGSLPDRVLYSIMAWCLPFLSFFYTNYWYFLFVRSGFNRLFLPSPHRASFFSVISTLMDRNKELTQRYSLLEIRNQRDEEHCLPPQVNSSSHNG